MVCGKSPGLCGLTELELTPCSSYLTSLIHSPSTVKGRGYLHSCKGIVMIIEDNQCKVQSTVLAWQQVFNRHMLFPIVG